MCFQNAYNFQGEQNFIQMKICKSGRHMQNHHRKDLSEFIVYDYAKISFDWNSIQIYQILLDDYDFIEVLNLKKVTSSQ